MRKYLEIAAIVALSLAAGAYLHRCQNPPAPPHGACGQAEADTVTYVDTVRVHLPAASGESALGPRVVYLPVFDRTRERGGTGGSDTKTNGAGGSYAGINGAGGSDTLTNGDAAGFPEDSVAVEIPITQKEYEGKEYHAWVSGYEPSLDSIFVFPRSDIITVREPLRVDNGKPKRWGIGVFAGYGMTPAGPQPCVGVSVNYNIWSF